MQFCLIFLCAFTVSVDELLCLCSVKWQNPVFQWLRISSAVRSAWIYWWIIDPTCGHSYCMRCITACWDQDDKGVYSCPQCRQTFTPRPVLCKNTMLAEVVEKLKNTKLQAARPVQCYSGSGDVECDVCTEDKNKAVKSCLVCLNSYCQNHLEQHETFCRGKRHNLMDATGRLQEMIWKKKCIKWSVLNMRNCWRFTVVLISSAYVILVQWMNTKTTTFYQLQQRGLRNRYEWIL